MPSVPCTRGLDRPSLVGAFVFYSLWVMPGLSATQQTQIQEQTRTIMTLQPAFKSASPYQDDVLALPVTDLDAASDWYSRRFGMTEVDRCTVPVPNVILERDGTRLGFAINGGDASQAGAAIRVANIQQIKVELESRGVSIANWRIDERDGQKLQVFFVVAPDGLCYYFHEPIDLA